MEVLSAPILVILQEGQHVVVSQLLLHTIALCSMTADNCTSKMNVAGVPYLHIGGRRFLGGRVEEVPFFIEHGLPVRLC